MKKLNITKEQFNRSRYFKNKYGKLEYVSESGKVFKTNKGKLLIFVNESDLMKDGRKDLEYFADKIDSIDEQLKNLIDEWTEELNSSDKMDSEYEFYLKQLTSAKNKILSVWEDIQYDLTPLDM